MSKIYDTLGRKYKNKGIDGMQDFGVGRLLFFLIKFKLLDFHCLVLLTLQGSSNSLSREKRETLRKKLVSLTLKRKSKITKVGDVSDSS